MLIFFGQDKDADMHHYIIGVYERYGKGIYSDLLDSQKSNGPM